MTLPSPTLTSEQACKPSYPLLKGERSGTSDSSPLAGEGARLGEPLGEPSHSGRGGFPSLEELLTRAKWMRSNPTESERHLWSVLRNKRFAGFKFKRQEVIEPFIVDFVCFKRRLIVEADGSQHAESGYDEWRDQCLKAEGFAILRLWNKVIMTEPNIAEDAIWHALHAPPLPPTATRRVPPSPARGEG